MRRNITKLIGCTLAAILLLLALTGCAGSAAKTPNIGETAVGETPVPAEISPHEVSVLFINVGRADAALIQIDGLSYLIDTGEKSSVPALYRGLALCGVNKLQAVFLTHTHSDHIGGMEALVKKYSVGTLYSAEISEDEKNGENKIDTLAFELSLPHVKLTAGDTVALAQGVFVEVLGPLTYNGDDDNDNSLVLYLRVNGKTLLFAGDMQFSEEETLLQSGTDLSADVLKVGNHGNPDATSKPFAAAVSPKIAIISTDTVEDPDSANAGVKEALNGAQIYVTQDYACGILLTVNADGTMGTADLRPQKTEADIDIAQIDKGKQTITLVNGGNDADLSGYFILSQKGSEVFVFPQGAMVLAGQTVTVSCKGGNGDYIWDEEKVWNAKKEDLGILYDRYGNEISRKT